MNQIDARIPKEWPLTTDLFVRDLENANHLDTEKLDKNELHFFLDTNPSSFHSLFMTAVEFLVFNPNDNNLNADFKLKIIRDSDSNYVWISIHQKYKDLIIKVASMYEMTLSNKGFRVGKFGHSETRQNYYTTFPKADHVYYVGTKKSYTEGEVLALTDALPVFANVEYKLGVD